MKKTIKILLGCIFLLLGILGTKSYAAISGNISLQAPDYVEKGEEISVYAYISNLQAGKGVIAIGTTLEYDTNGLTFVDIDGESKWSAPFHNEASGKLTATRNKPSNASENVFKITFRVKDNAGDAVWVRIQDFEISNGSEESKIGNSSVRMPVRVNQPEPPIEEEPPAEEPEQTVTTRPSTSTNNRPSTTTKKPTTQEEERPEETPPVEEPVEEQPVQNEVVNNTIVENVQKENILVMGQNNIQTNEQEMPNFVEKKDAGNDTWLIIAVVGVISILVIGVIVYAVKVLKK